MSGGSVFHAARYAVWLDGHWQLWSPVTGAQHTYLTAVRASLEAGFTAGVGYPPVMYDDGSGRWLPVDWPGARAGACPAPYVPPRRGRSWSVSTPSRVAAWVVPVVAVLLAPPTCCGSLFVLLVYCIARGRSGGGGYGRFGGLVIRSGRYARRGRRR